MATQKLNDINQLVGRFLDLQEQWADSPGTFNWPPLRVLATAGATSYNEGNGSSFQILATDGMDHGEFHLRFLEYSLEAGFDPFKLVRQGSGDAVKPVFAHESLAYAAQQNPWSARMLACLQNVARARFGSIDIKKTGLSEADLAGIMASCRDAIPADVFDALLHVLPAAEAALAACC